MTSETIDKKKKHELSKQAAHLDVIVNIGKNGLSESVIDGLKVHLKKRKLIKVKLLKSFIETNDKKEVAAKIAELTGSEFISMVGFVIVLWKR